jgi:hypothetical protein
MNKSTEKEDRARKVGQHGPGAHIPPVVSVLIPLVACRLSVCCSAAWGARHQGPRYLKFSWKVRYRQSDVEAFVASSVIDPAEHDSLKIVRRGRRV